MVVVYEYFSPKYGDRIDLNFIHRTAPADGGTNVDKMFFHISIRGQVVSGNRIVHNV